MSWDSQNSDKQPKEQKDFEDEIDKWRKEHPYLKDHPGRFKTMSHAFITLAEDRPSPTKYLSMYSITEASLRTNFKKLFGYPCDIFARILYMKMSGNKDYAKINFVQFRSIFMEFLADIKDRRNRAFFDLLDLKGKGTLDILTLLQLFNHIDRNTLFGQEVLGLIREYKQKNVLLSHGYRR